MGKLANIANNVLGAGGEYLPLNDLIADYPDGVTINGAYIFNSAKGNMPCFTFAEDANKYFYAVAGDLARLFENWLNGCNSDVNELNEALHAENVKVKIQKIRTKSGNTYTKAWVVGVIEKSPVELEEEDEDEEVEVETGDALQIPF